MQDNVSASPECLRQTVAIHRVSLPDEKIPSEQSCSQRLLNEAVGAAEWEERSGKSSKLAVKLGLVNFLQRFVAATATEVFVCMCLCGEGETHRESFDQNDFLDRKSEDFQII